MMGNTKIAPFGRIPSHWNVAKVRDEALIVTDYVANGSFASLKENVTYRDSEDYAVLIRQVDFNNNFSGPFVFVDQHAYDFLSKSHLYGGEIIISNVGNVGIVFRCPKLKYHMALAPNVIMTKFKGDDGFYQYWFKSPLGQQSLHSIESGSAQPKFNKTSFKDLDIPVPPIDEQKKIAAVLGSIDDKIENNRKICANLDAQAQALFNQMERRGQETTFTGLIDILSGGTPRTGVSAYWGGDIPFFSPKDVGCPYSISTERKITQEGLDNCNSALYPKGTTFVTARGTVGKVCLAGVAMAMNQSCFALASSEIDPLLVYFYTKASIDSLKAKANGSVFDAITIAEFETETIRRLTDDAERRFVTQIGPMFEQVLILQNESRALAEMRDALLPKLMSGEIDVDKVVV